MHSPCLMTDWAEELAFVLSNEQTRQQKHWHFKWGHGQQNLSLRLNPLFVMSQGLGCTEFYGYTFRSFEKWDNQVACGLEMVQTLWVLFRKEHELLKTPRSELLHCICNPALWGPLLFLVVYSAGHALFLTQWWMFHYIYIIIYHTHHITVVSHETCLLSGPGYDDSLYFFYINRQESQPSNAWFWALHRMLWHLPRLRFRPAALGRLKMAQEWPEPYIGLSERWAKNPGVRSLRSLLGYSCTAMHCNYLGGIDFVFGKQKAINQHFATCTKATNTWPATR